MSNIALVVLDTVRKDVFDEYFDWLPGLHFENAWAPSHYTVPSHAAMFTGKYPSEIGVHSKSEGLTCERSVLAELLQEAKYRTLAISGNILASPINSFDRGFDKYHFTGRAKLLSNNIFSWKEAVQESNYSGPLHYSYLISQCMFSDSDFLNSIKIGWKLKTGRFDGSSDTIDMISNIDFGVDEFLFINLMDAHAPYNPPRQYQTIGYNKRQIEDGIFIESVSELKDQKQAYRDSVNYLSIQYQKLFNNLKKYFDYIITVSDHGELFGEHETSKHYYGVYPELTHVPVHIYHEDIETTRITETVSLLDVHKTILELAEVDAPSRGQNLLDNVTGKEYLTESYGLRTSQFNTLKESDVDPALLEKIDRPLRGIAMPDNYYGYQTPDSDFVEQGTARVSDPRDRFHKIIEEISVEGMENDTEQVEDLSPDVRSQLDNLGYL